MNGHPIEAFTPSGFYPGLSRPRSSDRGSRASRGRAHSAGADAIHRRWRAARALVGRGDAGVAAARPALLPGECVVLACSTAAQVGEAIRTLQVRGAPAIGGAAAYGLALGAREALPSDEIIPLETALARLNAIAAELRATRPTAVNLAWALERLLIVAERHCLAEGAVADLPARLLAEAHAIAAEDAAACRIMGELGSDLIADGDTLLTHCNAGALATCGIGTALAPSLHGAAPGQTATCLCGRDAASLAGRAIDRMGTSARGCAVDAHN